MKSYMPRFRIRTESPTDLTRKLVMGHEKPRTTERLRVTSRKFLAESAHGPYFSR
jgi:hypothetical protein